MQVGSIPPLLWQLSSRGRGGRRRPRVVGVCGVNVDFRSPPHRHRFRWAVDGSATRIPKTVVPVHHPPVRLKWNFPRPVLVRQVEVGYSRSGSPARIKQVLHVLQRLKQGSMDPVGILQRPTLQVFPQLLQLSHEVASVVGPSLGQNPAVVCHDIRRVCYSAPSYSACRNSAVSPRSCHSALCDCCSRGCCCANDANGSLSSSRAVQRTGPKLLRSTRALAKAQGEFKNLQVTLPAV